MSKWREARFKDVIEFNPKVKLDKNKHYPNIGIADINESSFFVYENELLEYIGQSSSKFESGDVLFSRITPCLENRKIARVSLRSTDRGFGSTELFVFRGKNGKTLTEFVSYLAQTDMVVLPAINSMSGASGRQRADKYFIEKLKIKIPELKTQKKIADVLSTYDELIENNNRRIEILEKTAEEIYKEWFVRMRFPGHENTKFEKGVPEGWEVKKVGELVKKTESGKRPKENCIEERMVVSLGAGDIKNLGMYSDSNEYLIPYRFFKEMNKGKVEDRDIAIYKDGAYTGKTTMFRAGFPYNDIAVNEHVFLIQCKEYKLQNYLLFTFKQKPYFDLMQILSMTSAQPGLNQRKLKNIKIEIPNKNLIEEFHIFAEDILKQIFNLAKQNQNLAKQRDLLLPRLMNGTIEVN